MEPKRVLIIVGKMHYGGIETMIMNFYRNIDRTKVQFDFMLNYQEKGDYDDEIRSLGGRIFILPRLFLKNTFRYLSAVNRFFREHKEYQIVHGHLTSVGMFYSIIAKMHGVKTTIIHAHSAAVQNNLKGIVEKAISLPLKFCADYYFACSNLAGKFHFGKKMLAKPNYQVIKNGIYIDRFVFNQEVRDLKRSEFSLQGKFVVAHIGRFEAEKNHVFIIDIFSEIYKENSDAVLLLIGTGSLKNKIEEKVKKLGFDQAVIWLDKRSDINCIMQMIDVFLLPSFYEGLPVVGIEAQAAGVPCFFSDAITREVAVTDLCTFISLNKDANIWANKILKFQHNFVRKGKKEELINAGYDIVTQSKWLEKFYLEH